MYIQKTKRIKSNWLVIMWYKVTGHIKYKEFIPRDQDYHKIGMWNTHYPIVQYTVHTNSSQRTFQYYYHTDNCPRECVCVCVCGATQSLSVVCAAVLCYLKCILCLCARVLVDSSEVGQCERNTHLQYGRSKSSCGERREIRNLEASSGDQQHGESSYGRFHPPSWLWNQQSVRSTMPTLLCPYIQSSSVQQGLMIADGVMSTKSKRNADARVWT